MNLQARGVLGTNATDCSGRLVLNWCTFQAQSHSSRQRLKNGVKRCFDNLNCFASNLLASCSAFYKKLLIVPRKVDNTSFFAALLRNLGQQSSQTGYKITMSGTCSAALL